MSNSLIEKAIEDEWEKDPDGFDISFADIPRFLESMGYSKFVTVDDCNDFARKVSSRSISDLLDEISKEIERLEEEATDGYPAPLLQYLAYCNALGDLREFLQKKKQELEK